jgi:hypothetical protein
LNVTSDYVPPALVDFDDCLKELKTIPFENILLHIPLVNVMSTVDDLRVASVKTDEVQQMIREQELRHSQNLYAVATSWWSILGTMSLFFMCILCSCYCCKCCKTCTFWL